MADGEKLCSTICSTLEALVVKRLISCYGEELGSLC